MQTYFKGAYYSPPSDKYNLLVYDCKMHGIDKNCINYSLALIITACSLVSVMYVVVVYILVFRCHERFKSIFKKEC